VWEGFWAPDGRAFDVQLDEDGVKMTLTDRDAAGELDERLERAVAMLGLSAPPADRIAIANALQREWDARWPKRPRWLDRRLNGTGPAQFD
jgi:hypothetical protein